MQQQRQQQQQQQRQLLLLLLLDKTALDRGRTDRIIAWPTTLTLTFSPLRATVMTYSHTKFQGQRSVGSEERMQTDGRRRLHYLPGWYGRWQQQQQRWTTDAAARTDSVVMTTALVHVTQLHRSLPLCISLYVCHWQSGRGVRVTWSHANHLSLTDFMHTSRMYITLTAYYQCCCQYCYLITNIILYYTFFLFLRVRVRVRVYIDWLLCVKFLHVLKLFIAWLYRAIVYLLYSVGWLLIWRVMVASH